MVAGIERVRGATDSEWDAAWSGCDYATFFHSRIWSEIWAEYTDGWMTPAPELIRFSDGVEAIIPLTVKKAYRGLVATSLSAAAGTYGGWISAGETGDIGCGHTRSLTRFLLGKSSLQWRVNPFDETVHDLCLCRDYGEFARSSILHGRDGTAVEGVAARRMAAISIQPDNTQAIDLNRGFNRIMADWTKNNMRASRRAAHLGVTVRNAETNGDWQAYYRIYQDALGRWGDRATSHYGRTLFHVLSKSDPKYVRLWLAIFKGEPIAGILCLNARSHLAVWHAATLRGFLPLRPFNLLVREAIEDACERRLRWFDFNPSGGHEGVSLYKQRLGAVAISSPVVVVESSRLKVAKRCAGALRKIGLTARKPAHSG